MAVGNPLGAVCLFDGENPRTITGKAIQTISGGQFVYISGADGSAQVGSQAASFQDGDLDFGLQVAADRCNGIALTNAGSDDLITVATRGAYLVRAGQIVSGGALVKHNASGGVANHTPLTGSAAVQ